MTALIAMRLRGFVRSGRAFAPLLAALVVIGLAYGGGDSTPGEAYGFTSIVIFPVIAWQTKILLDSEPDVQRRLARVAVGPRRELLAGIAVAAIAGLLAAVIAMALPWLIGGIKAPQHGSLAGEILAGAWVQLLAIPPAVAVGALASRALTGAAGRGALALASGVVLAIVLSLPVSPAPWLAPPLMRAARLTALHAGDVGGLAAYTAWGLAWSAAALAGYARLRRRRS